MLGRVYENRSGIKGEILDVIVPSDPRSTKKYTTMVKIKFNSGYEDYYDIRNVRKGVFRDYGTPNEAGGYTYKGRSSNDKVYNLWNHMMNRCYNEKTGNYSDYGGRGVKVCERWHHLKNFEEDIKSLPRYEKFLIETSEYSLDKDILGMGRLIYSPETCMFANAYEQSQNRRNSRVVRAKKDGISQDFPSINQASLSLGVQRSNIDKVLKGIAKTTGGYTFEDITHGVSKRGI